MSTPSLRSRLLVSYVAVAGSGALTLLVSMRLLVPRLYDDRVGGFGRRVGEAGTAASQREAVVAALDTALAVSLAASIVVGAVAAVVVTARVLRPLDALRAATRRLAAGRYDTPVVVPREPELAALAGDVNHLAAVLAATEQHRAALIGDVAHEMRTPLATIAGYLEGFGDGLFDADEMTATVTAEVARLHRLAGDLSEVSRAEETPPALDRADVDLVEVVTAAVDRFRPGFAASGVAVAVHAAGPVTVSADRERLERAVANLVGNALAYTPAGGSVTVGVDTVGANTVGRGGRVTVTDTGRGLAAEQLARVFERFYRADRHDRTGGTGIGLTIARAIARAHGGDLTARSPGPGRGATFELTVPTTGAADRPD